MKNNTDEIQENDLYEQAWLLWNKVNDIADQLWQACEQYFIQKCIDMDNQEYEKNGNINR